jgi:hypothetical protein
MKERRETTVFSKDAWECYRIFRSYNGNEVVVVEHKRDVDASDFICGIVGKGPFNYAYETLGKTIDRFKTGSGWSNKKVVAFVKECIEDSYSGRYYG